MASGYWRVTAYVGKWGGGVRAMRYYTFA